MLYHSRASLSLLLLGSLEVSATYYEPTYGFAIPNRYDKATKDLVREANQHPNATRSLKFRPFLGLRSQFMQGTGVDPENIEWTWRVNVSSFAAANAEQSRELPPLSNPHVVNTAYDFSWPEGGNMSNAFGGAGHRFCVSNVMATDFPANISDLYTNEHITNTVPTDCTPVLGTSCVTAILSNFGSNSKNGCRGLDRSWASLPGCASTFGYISKTAHLFGIQTKSISDSAELNSTASSLSNDTTSLARVQSGEGFWGALTGAHNSTNPTTYLAATNTLQIVAIDLRVNSSGSEVSVAPQLLCMRVNTTRLSTTNDVNGDGIVSTGEGAGVAPGKNAADTTGIFQWWVALVVLISMSIII